MTTIAEWQNALWAELDELPPEKQFILAGAWIANITQNLLPELGLRRRENVLEMLAQDGWSIATVAGVLGMRRSTVSRLVDEGRSLRKQAREESAQRAA
jgi:AraC-like DNA-binding protein